MLGARPLERAQYPATHSSVQMCSSQAHNSVAGSPSMPTTPTRSPELQAGTANWARQCHSLATALQQSHSTAYLQLGWEKHHLMVCSTSVALACCACQALERCRDEPVQTPGDQKHARKDMPNPTAPCRRPHIACAQESSVACVRVLHAGLGADCAWLGQYEVQRDGRVT